MPIITRILSELRERRIPRGLPFLNFGINLGGHHQVGRSVYGHGVITSLLNVHIVASAVVFSAIATNWYHVSVDSLSISISEGEGKCKRKLERTHKEGAYPPLRKCLVASNMPSFARATSIPRLGMAFARRASSGTRHYA